MDRDQLTRRARRETLNLERHRGHGREDADAIEWCSASRQGGTQTFEDTRLEARTQPSIGAGGPIYRIALAPERMAAMGDAPFEHCDPTQA